MTGLQIVRAGPEDSAILTHIAHSAKRHWGYPEKWIAIWRDALTIRPEAISRDEAFMATIEDRVLGFYSLVLEDEIARLEHLWVLPEFMGRSIGRALFAHALARAGTMGCRQIEIESDPNAAGFYQHMGARRVSVKITKVEGQSRELPILVCDISDSGPSA